MNKKEINPEEITPEKIQSILDELVDFLQQLPSERYQVLKSMLSPTIQGKLDSEPLERLKKGAEWKNIMFSILEKLFLQVIEEWASGWIEEVVASTQIWTSVTGWKSRWIFMPIWEALSAEEKRKLVFGKWEEKDAKRINDLVSRSIEKIQMSEFSERFELDNKRISDEGPRDKITYETPETILEQKEDIREKSAELQKLRKKHQMLRYFSGLELQIIMRIEKASQSISDIKLAKKKVAQEFRIDDPNKLDILWLRYKKTVDKLTQEETGDGTPQS